MTRPVALLITLTIPKMLCDCFHDPHEAKGWLCEQGLWPQGVHVERWRYNSVTPGYVVEIEASVRLPSPCSETPPAL